jgi:hypothetical protein
MVMGFANFGSQLVVLSALLPGAVHAYQLNPLKNKYHGDRPRGGGWEQISQTVHEDITDAALKCAAQRRAQSVLNTTPCINSTDESPRHQIGNKYDPLIRGVWWNDDPNQHLFGVHYATWAIWMNDAQGIARKQRNWLGRRTTLTSGYKMQYRSHYGDLQFLHAMANNDGEAPKEIQQRIIDWMEFAYAIAIGQVEPDTTMGDLDFRVARNYFTRQSGWTVNHLLAPNFTLGKATIPKVALGSLLHVVQDSYSKAHVQRSYRASAACPSGGISEFHAYNHQNSDKHASADTRASWLTDTDFTPLQNPVEQSARLINMVSEKADWKTAVEPYLRSVTFCLSDGAGNSSSGTYG